MKRREEGKPKIEVQLFLSGYRAKLGKFANSLLWFPRVSGAGILEQSSNVRKMEVEVRSPGQGGGQGKKGEEKKRIGGPGALCTFRKTEGGQQGKKINLGSINRG